MRLTQSIRMKCCETISALHTWVTRQVPVEPANPVMRGVLRATRRLRERYAPPARRGGAMVLLLGMLLSLAAVPSAQAEPAALSADDQVLRLGFENSLADSVNASRPTSAVGSNYSYVDGVVPGSKALKFQGGTAIDLGNASDVQAEDFSFSTWVKPDATIAAGAEQFFAWTKHTWDSAGWYVGMTASQSLVVSVGSSVLEVSVPQATMPKSDFYPAGEWTHLFVTYDHTRNTVTAYRNGRAMQLEINRSGGGQVGSTTQSKRIGNNGASYNSAYLTNIALDELTVWKGAANLTDVVSEYLSADVQDDRMREISAFANTDAAAAVGSLPTGEVTGSLVSLIGVGSSYGSVLTWESSDRDVINPTSGVVARPTDGNKEVTLTVTADYGGITASNSATLTVRQASTSDQDKAMEDLDALLVPTSTTQDLVLPTLGGLNGAAITWSSSDSSSLSIGAEDTLNHQIVATVTAKETDTDIMLSAQASLNGVTAGKEFPLRVLSLYSQHFLSQSDMKNVTITDPYLKNTAELEIDYLLSFDVDRLLVEARATAGLPTKGAKNYGGWESGPTGNDPVGQVYAARFTGHFVGHWVSAASEAYRATIATPAQRAALGDMLKDFVTGLSQAQEAYAEAQSARGYAWKAGHLPFFTANDNGGFGSSLYVPFYNLHKVEQGLLDVYKWGPDQETRDKALSVAGKYADFIVSFKERKNPNLLNVEYGGMAESLYELFSYSKDPNHYKAANYFSEYSLFAALATGSKSLSGLHANTTIPKLTGALKRYQIFTEDPSLVSIAGLSASEITELTSVYKQSAERFWKLVVEKHSFVTGDNSVSEHFYDSDAQYELATSRSDAAAGYNNNSTSETCNANNMLKLTRALLQVDRQARYSEYYETTFINAIVSSQNPETGMTTYFQPMKAGYSKVFGVPGTALGAQFDINDIGEYWCCQGTGIENFAKLNDSFYFTDTTDVYVNIFKASTFRDARHNLLLTQTGDIPTGNVATFSAESLDGGAIASGTTLKLRIPDWATQVSVQKNESQQEVASADDLDANGWLSVPIAAGDVVTYRFADYVTSVVPAADNENFIAFTYGPLVLVSQLGTVDVGGFGRAGAGSTVRMASWNEDAYKQSILVTADGVDADDLAAAKDVLIREDDGLSFRLNGDYFDSSTAELTFVPYYSEYTHRYAIYHDVAVIDSAAYQSKVVSEKASAREAARIIDSLDSFDGNNSEGAKNVRTQDGGAETGNIGSWNSASYRSADGASDEWFSYEMIVDKDKGPNYVGVRYALPDAPGRSHLVLIEGAGEDGEDVRIGVKGVKAPEGSSEFYWEYYEIPDEVLNTATYNATKQAYTLRVKFAKDPNKITTVGGVFGLRTVWGECTANTPVYGSDPQLASLTFSLSRGDGEVNPVPDPVFDPAKSFYTLRVPQDSDALLVDIGLGEANGYARVNDIVIDDTRPRMITLSGDESVLNITAYAEDHITMKHYKVTILKGESEASTPKDHEIARFDFNDLTPGSAQVTDATGKAKALINGAVATSTNPLDASVAADMSGKVWMNVVGQDAKALLAGVEEATFSYDSLSGADPSWTLYAAQTSAAQSNGAERYFGVLDRAGTFTVERYNGGRGNSGNVSTAGSAVWKHIDIVVSASATKLYVNGTLVSINAAIDADHALGAILGDDGGVLQIGKANWGGGEYFNGQIDNLVISDRALSDADIVEEPNVLSDNAALSSLSLEGRVIDLDIAASDKGASVYLDEVDGVGVEAFLAVSEDANATVRSAYSDGTATIIVTAENGSSTKTYRVHVIKRRIVSLLVDSPPVKTTYRIGEAFVDPSGLLISADWNDGGRTHLASDAYELSGFDSSSAGTKIITVTLKASEAAVSTSFTVTVERSLPPKETDPSASEGSASSDAPGPVGPGSAGSVAIPDDRPHADDASFGPLAKTGSNLTGAVASAVALLLAAGVCAFLIRRNRSQR